jgi:hypothetical protein
MSSPLFNQFGEPLLLIILELSFWAVIALAESFVLVAVLEEIKSPRCNSMPISR